LDLHAPDENSGESSESFYEEVEQVFNHFRKYHMKILVGDFESKVGGENIFNQLWGMGEYNRIVMIMVLE
jgi:hypothetical protein